MYVWRGGKHIETAPNSILHNPAKDLAKRKDTAFGVALAVKDAGRRTVSTTSPSRAASTTATPGARDRTAGCSWAARRACRRDLRREPRLRRARARETVIRDAGVGSSPTRDRNPGRARSRFWRPSLSPCCSSLGDDRQGIRGATDAASSGAVTDVEVRSMRVKVGSFTEELPYLVLHYRTRDGLAGSVSVGDSRTAGALSMTTAQPMPPPGYYEEVSSWRERARPSRSRKANTIRAGADSGGGERAPRLPRPEPLAVPWQQEGPVDAACAVTPRNDWPKPHGTVTARLSTDNIHGTWRKQSLLPTGQSRRGLQPGDLVNVDQLGTPQAQDSGSPAAPFAALQPGRHLWLPHRQLPQNARLVHTAQPGEVRHDFVHTGRGTKLCESFRFGYLLAAAQ